MSEPPTAQSHRHPVRLRATTQGLLAIWHGVESGFEPAADQWYDRQHHLERVSVPGFQRARRYLNVDAGPRYFSRYDVQDAQVLASPAYLHAVNHPTDWTREIVPRYRHTTRAVFRFAAGVGDADGGDLITLRLAGAAAAPVAFGADEMAHLARVPGVLRIESWSTDSVVSTLHTEEKQLRAAADDVVAQAFMVEGSDMGRLTDAVTQHLLPRLAAPVTLDRYRLVYQVQRAPTA